MAGQTTNEHMDQEVDAAIRSRGIVTRKPFVFFSAYKVDEDDEPINNLDEVAVEGKCRFENATDSFWGNGEDYISPVITNPTWLDLCVLANDMIKTTDDHHHVFLEGVEKIRMDGDVAVYEFVMGS